MAQPPTGSERKPRTESFAARLRHLLEAHRVTQAELAARSELAPSLVSRLAAEADEQRREPRLEHVLALARALEITPGELVADTDAATVLFAYVSREEFDIEAAARAEAQAEAARVRTELAGVRSQLKAAENNNDQLERDLEATRMKLVQADEAAQRRIRAIMVERDSSTKEREAAILERENALARAKQNYLAWTNAKSLVEQLQVQLQQAKATGWLKMLAGAAAGGIVGAIAASPDDEA